MANVIYLKFTKAARKALDCFYSKILGRPRITLEGNIALTKDIEKKFPYLKVYSKN